jgi:hypothetical protein
MVWLKTKNPNIKGDNFESISVLPELNETKTMVFTPAIEPAFMSVTMSVFCLIFSPYTSENHVKVKMRSCQIMFL